MITRMITLASTGAMKTRSITITQAVTSTVHYYDITSTLVVFIPTFEHLIPFLFLLILYRKGIHTCRYVGNYPEPG